MWELDYKESWAPKNWSFWTVVLEKTLESPLDCKENKPMSAKGNQCWIFIGRTDAESPILWPADAENWLIGKDWCWERSKAGGEGDDIGWDGRLASLTQWTWVWRSSGSWWCTGKSGMLYSMGWTGRPGVLRFMGSQRVRHDWVTKLNWTELIWLQRMGHNWTTELTEHKAWKSKNVCKLNNTLISNT